MKPIGDCGSRDLLALRVEAFPRTNLNGGPTAKHALTRSAFLLPRSGSSFSHSFCWSSSNSRSISGGNVGQSPTSSRSFLAIDFTHARSPYGQKIRTARKVGQLCHSAWARRALSVTFLGRSMVLRFCAMRLGDRGSRGSRFATRRPNSALRQARSPCEVQVLPPFQFLAIRGRWVPCRLRGVDVALDHRRSDRCRDQCRDGAPDRQRHDRPQRNRSQALKFRFA
jgi:hypothetical protein